MAFQAPALPGIAAATTELWPSMVNVLGSPWRTAGQQGPKDNSPRALIPDRPRPLSEAVQHSTRQALPEYLQIVKPLTLSMFNVRVTPHTYLNIQNLVAGIPQGACAAVNPVARRAFIKPATTRKMSTFSAFNLHQPKRPFTKILRPQQRTLFGTNTSRNLLAHMEETANKNPGNANVQYAFYQALLRANMPSIVVERFQTGQFASNTACETAYQKALAGMGQGEVGFGGGNVSGQTGNLNNQQLQAIGQAVAASSRGGNVAIARGQGAAGSTGARDSPLYVVVEETIGGTIFKWVKLILYFGLITYICLAVLTVAIESLGTLRRVGGKADNEAKAEQQTARFSDVHGCDEAKEELQELVDFLKNPEKFSTLGGKLPKGVLLVGPPGTGKTLLARAVAGEAGVPFFFMSGSEFDEVYVGVGAKRVRDLFAAAKAKSPAIVFIDELDAIGGKRNARDAAYVKQTLNQLLTELDGFEQNSGVIILAATNFPELLDKALTRPGRFDRNVVVGLPDVRGRVAILKHHMKHVLAGPEVDLEALAAGTPGFSGAELENIINQAAVRASKAKAQAVSMSDFEWAKDKVMMGAEKKSMVISPKEKELTAYHEAGHALVCMYTKGANSLHKITIMPRGQSLGMTMHLPEMDKYSQSMSEYQAHIDVCLGGKIAEELTFGDDQVTSGVASDLQKATAIAYAMVTQFGMSSKLGNVDLASNRDRLSSETKRLIESEVRRTIEEARVRATNLLKERKNELDLLAKALIDYETLNKEEAYKVIKGEKLEGKPVMPKGSIKLPESMNQPGVGGTGGLGGIGGVPPLPPLAGVDSGDDGGRTPPKGGVMA